MRFLGFEKSHVPFEYWTLLILGIDFCFNGSTTVGQTKVVLRRVTQWDR